METIASTESDGEDMLRKNRRVNFADPPGTPARGEAEKESRDQEIVRKVSDIGQEFHLLSIA